jgi:hypothetical protein
LTDRRTTDAHVMQIGVDEDEVTRAEVFSAHRRALVPLICWSHTGSLMHEGSVVAPVGAFLRELAACGRPGATQRSYGMDLLRWFRFLWEVEIGWDQATRVEARDFCSWIQLADKPIRPHWR